MQDNVSFQLHTPSYFLHSIIEAITEKSTYQKQDGSTRKNFLQGFAPGDITFEVPGAQQQTDDDADDGNHH